MLTDAWLYVVQIMCVLCTVVSVPGRQTSLKLYRQSSVEDVLQFSSTLFSAPSISKNDVIHHRGRIFEIHPLLGWSYNRLLRLYSHTVRQERRRKTTTNDDKLW